MAQEYKAVINASIAFARSLQELGLPGPYVVRLSHEEGERLTAMVKHLQSSAGHYETANVHYEWPTE